MGLYYADGKGNALKISSNAGKWLPATWSGGSGTIYYMDDNQGDLFFKGIVTTTGKGISINLPNHTGYKIDTEEITTVLNNDNSNARQEISVVAINGNKLTLEVDTASSFSATVLQLSYIK